MMNTVDLKIQAEGWIDCWNSRDLDKIMDHYADDIELWSPFVVDRWKIAEGRITGKRKLKSHFKKAFLNIPGRTLQLLEVLAGVDKTILVIYETQTGEVSADLIGFNETGKVRSVRSFYRLASK